jgi:hypothetical protein
MARTVACFIACSLVLSRLSPAQGPESLHRGQRIRVLARCVPASGDRLDCSSSQRSQASILQTFVGEVEALDGTTLHLRPPGDTAEVVMAANSIRALEVSDGIHDHSGTGIGIGALSGALIGGVVLSQLLFGPFAADAKAIAVGAAMGVVPGFLIGGAIGASSRSERWLRLPLSISHRRIEAALRFTGPAVVVSLKMSRE